MEKFVKITAGFVLQNFEKDANGKFICTCQTFIASDDVQFHNENVKGKLTGVPDYEYQPFNMIL